jgi:antitoxin Phd
MKRSRWSASVAQDRLGAILKAVRREPQTITRHGKPVAVILSAAEYDRLRNGGANQIPSFGDWLLSMPKDDGEFPRMEFEPREVDFGPP